MTLAEFNALPAARAVEELLRCCGCRAWARETAAGRPYPDRGALLAAAARAWAGRGREEILEAFSHHPRIGGADALRARFSATAGWSRAEQAGAAAAGEEALAALARGNAEYEARFGHIFVVCATGKSAAEMLALLRARLGNSPEAELSAAAAEQAKITALRLEKLLT